MIITNNQYLKLEEGANVIRILSKPWQYICHSNIKQKGMPNYGQKMWCKRDVDCKFCAIPEAGITERRWLFMVLDHRDRMIKLLDIGHKVFLYIRQIAVNPQWGDPVKYDIELQLDQFCHTITVIPYPPTELTQVDMELVKKADMNILQYLTHADRAKSIDDLSYELVNWEEDWVESSAD